MHSLEPEYRALHAANLIDERTVARAVALERGDPFSVFEELRFALYGAVAAITAGVGILVKQHLDHIGPPTLILTLAWVAAACYASAIRTRTRGATRSIGGDYLLLLGALLVSADVGYAESQFHWLGAHWAWYLLMLAAAHAATAYALDSRLVLSVALTSLAGWFGVDEHLGTLIALDGELRRSGIEAILCAAVILGWRMVHERLRAPVDFISVFEHFAVNLGFWGALALCATPQFRWLAVGALVVFAMASIRHGMHTRQEAFVVYGIGYATFGLCIVEAQTIGETVIAIALALVTVVAALILLWQFHQRLKEFAA